MTDGRVMETYKARDLMRLIAEGTHVCGDPGHAVRHDDQRVAHVPEHGPDQRVEPVLRVHVPGRLGVQPGVDQPDEVRRRTTASSTWWRYRAAIRTLITAQEIIVDNASYPTPAIEQNSHAYRPLGLGYANLGALLMSRGLPYDSDAGRDCAAALTALMTGEAYAQSARIARDHGGPFAGYETNREPFLRVMRKHRDALQATSTPGTCPADLYAAARAVVGRGRASSASVRATATRRRRCSRRPARSAS